MKVYLAGAINDVPDPREWRRIVAKLLHTAFKSAGLDVEIFDPTGFETKSMTPFQLVQFDLKVIKSCDVVLVNGMQPSWGTAMELQAAFRWGLKTVTWTGGIHPEKLSPWLRVHSTTVLATQEQAVDYILNHAKAKGGKR